MSSFIVKESLETQKQGAACPSPDGPPCSEQMPPRPASKPTQGMESGARQESSEHTEVGLWLAMQGPSCCGTCDFTGARLHLLNS